MCVNARVEQKHGFTINFLLPLDWVSFVGSLVLSGEREQELPILSLLKHKH